MQNFDGMNTASAPRPDTRILDEPSQHIDEAKDRLEIYHAEQEKLQFRLRTLGAMIQAEQARLDSLQAQIKEESSFARS